MGAMIGLVGGMGPYAGLDLLKKVYDNVDARSDQDYPDVAMISASRLIPDRSHYIKHPETENPAVGIMYCVERLARMGATHVGVSCNTAHAPIIMNQVRAYVGLEELPVELLSIVEEAYRYAIERVEGERIALFATEGTYLSRIYHTVFEKDGRFEIVEPGDEDKRRIWDSIYDKEFGIKAKSNPVDQRAVDNFRIVSERMMDEERISTFIMGCTEIPLGMCRLRLPATLIDPATVLARSLIQAVAPKCLRDAAAQPGSARPRSPVPA
jgi:aspartate racemase